MAGARPRLPQFDTGDGASPALVAKLRALVRGIELGDTTTTATASGAVAAASPGATGGRALAGSGAPGSAQGQRGDLYVDLGAGHDGARPVYYKAGHWEAIGVLSAQGGHGQTNTAATIGTGVALTAAKMGSVLQFKSLVPGAGVALVESEDAITIAVTGGVDGGYFTHRRGATTIQIARGERARLPTLGAPGELFITEDSHELYIGTGAGMAALAVAITHVTGLLDDSGTIRAELIADDAAGPRVYYVANDYGLRALDARYGDQAFVGLADPLIPYVYDGVAWHATSPTIPETERALITLEGQFVLDDTGSQLGVTA